MLAPPWSYTVFDAFENCPLRYKHKYILREKEPETEHTRHGNLVHSALENRVRNNEVLPVPYRVYEPLAGSVARAASKPGACVLTEYPFGVNRKLEPVGFFDKNVWGRGKGDVIIVNGPRAWIGDWKTGKRREKKDQLEIFSAFLFVCNPEVETVTATNLWLKEGKVGEIFIFHKRDTGQVWAEITRKAERIEKAVETDRFPPKPSPLCAYCAVHKCQFNPNYKGKP